MVDMTVTLAGVRLRNPIVAASGAFAFGREYGEYYSLARLGALTVKGLNMEGGAGNPPPRVAETPCGMLNSVGLQNPGVAAFLRDELPYLRQYDLPVIANIYGADASGYARAAGALADKVELIELNISCPNVKQGGMAFGAEPDTAAEITAAAVAEAGCPVLVKLTPNTAKLAEVAKAVRQAGAAGVSLINTLSAMRIDTASRRPVLRSNTGGLSGPAVLPVAVRCIHTVFRSADMPILGMGGVASGLDAAELMLAGARAVAIGTAAFADLWAPVRVIEELEAYCRAQGVARVSELTGGVRLWP
ncbi:MAG: dihydroorotate dehydrogenase [Oscillospiraceae bacterium]|jgi:dihydroorotate dehydrogenase (NAD+) catalytic subunit|nr:dihydroorotate dehydrogenase [Oscillospiraceae bacterium]